MQASRILRSAAEKQGGLLLPPRTSMDIVASAANAVLNLFSSEDQRKRFATLVNKGVISPEVLGHANLSYFRILALHDELDSPILKDHGFNVNEFLDGVKPALEQLHEVQANLQNKLNEIATTDDKDNDDQQGEGIIDLTDKNMLPSMLFPNPDTDKIVRRLLQKKHSWKEVAQKEPESDEARLIAMLSPQHLERFELASKLGFGFAPYFYDLNVQVHNVALLSARAVILDEDAESMDDSITAKEAREKVMDNEEPEKSLAVVAQIEVLYDVEETLVVPAKAGDDAEADTAKKTEGDSEEEETKSVTRTNVVVGVFEGWLSGGDEEGLRWKVADVRYPFEFPLFMGRGLH